MFSGIVLVADPDACGALEVLANESKQVRVHRSFTQFPTNYELVRTLNTFAPEIIILDLSDWEVALGLVDTIRSHSPGTAIIGYGEEWLRSQASGWLEVGVSALLMSPLSTHKFSECVDQAIHAVRAPVQENLIAILPAKAGNGATTVVLNVAGCLAESLEKRVLVIESDLHSGVLSVLINATPRHSIMDVLENSGSLDYSGWTNYKVRAQGVDFLLAKRPKRPVHPAWSDYHQLLQFALPRYDTIVVDLPEVINDATVEIVRRASSVFAVCTPEVPSLELAKQRWQELRGRGVSSERFSILLNRWQKDGMQAAEVETMLGLAVTAVFPNDYKSVLMATVGSQLVNRDTDLGKAFLSFARKLSGVAEPVPTKSRLHFLKMLSGKPEKAE